MAHAGAGIVRHSPAAQRNKSAILEVLRRYLAAPTGYSLLEVASGAGTHVAHLSAHLPNVAFHPTEFDRSLLADVAACVRTETGREPGEEGCNVRRPRFLDASRPAEALAQLGRGGFDAVLCINMMHITPYRCSEGLFELSGGLLRPGGRLFTYGPYAENARISPESNVAFDATLRRQCPDWGLRDIRDLNDEASKNGLCLEASHELPANNKLLVWKKL